MHCVSAPHESAQAPLLLRAQSPCPRLSPTPQEDAAAPHRMHPNLTLMRAQYPLYPPPPSYPQPPAAVLHRLPPRKWPPCIPSLTCPFYSSLLLLPLQATSRSTQMYCIAGSPHFQHIHTGSPHMRPHTLPPGLYLPAEAVRRQQHDPRHRPARTPACPAHHQHVQECSGQVTRNQTMVG